MASYATYDATAKAAIAADMTVTYNSGTGGYDIRMVGSPSGDRYSVLVLHRWLQDLADEGAISGDDEVAITVPNPSERKTDNVIVLQNGFNIDDTVAQYLFNGSIEQDTGNVLYAGLQVIGSVVDGTTLQIVQNNALLTAFWGAAPNALNAGYPSADTIMNILVKVKDAGSWIDGGRIRVQARYWGATYAYAYATLGTGITPVAVSTSTDLNNTSTEANAASYYTALTITEGYLTQDLDNDGTSEPYYVKVDYGTNSAAQTYEALKYIQREGSAETIFGLSGELFLGITHKIPVSSVTGSFQTAEQISWAGTKSGTAQVLAYDGSTTLWVQLLTGEAPASGDSITGATSGATATAGAVASYNPPSYVWAGQFTGSAWIGGYGFSIDFSDVTKDDTYTDLNDVTHTPPNYQQGVVTNLTAGEFYVLVAPSTGSGSTTIQFDQLSVSGSHSSTDTTLTVSTAIPADTPASGYIRVQKASGSADYAKVQYTSWSGSTFTLAAQLGFALAGGENVFVAYLDTLASATSESFTAVYTADRPMVVRVRDGGATPIKPFETPATFTSTGFSVATIVIADE